MSDMRRRVGVATLALVLPLAWVGQAGADLVNGSFETGDFTGFTRTGFVNAAGGPTSGGPTYQTFLAAQIGSTAQADSNAVVTSQTTAFDGNGTAGPAVGPTNGNFLAFVSNETSGGDGTLTGSSIAQTFTVPVGATSLSFNARLLNNDSPENFVPFDDFGGIALTRGATVLAQYNLDLDPASGAKGHVTAGANVGGFQNSTPWLSSSLSLAGLGGQPVTLTAYAVTYGGDNNVETRLLLDNISTNAVPEPGSLASFAIGALVVGLGYAWRRRRTA